MPLGNESYILLFFKGAGCEVGRSCIILKYKGKTVMVILEKNLIQWIILVWLWNSYG